MNHLSWLQPKDKDSTPKTIEGVITKKYKTDDIYSIYIEKRVFDYIRNESVNRIYPAIISQMLWEFLHIGQKVKAIVVNNYDFVTVVNEVKSIEAIT